MLMCMSETEGDNGKRDRESVEEINQVPTY